MLFGYNGRCQALITKVREPAVAAAKNPNKVAVVFGCLLIELGVNALMLSPAFVHHSSSLPYAVNQCGWPMRLCQWARDWWWLREFSIYGPRGASCYTQGRRIAPHLSFSAADYSRSTVQVAEIQSSRLGPARDIASRVESVFVGVVVVDLTCKRKRQRDLASDKPSEWERARYFCYIFLVSSRLTLRWTDFPWSCLKHLI